MPNIPLKANHKRKNCFSPFLFRNRNAIERMFCRRKDFCRVATRYGRCRHLKDHSSSDAEFRPATLTGAGFGAVRKCLDKTAKMAISDHRISRGHTMQSMSAKDAKYGFGRLIDLARSEPILVAKHGRPVVVVLSVEEYQRLKGSEDKNLTKSKTARSTGTEET